MFLTFLLTLIGGSIGSILALGTAWASVKRYFQRTLARHLADIIPRDVPTAVILARNHEGKEKARWVGDILAKSELVNNENTTILDLAGGTHFDLLEELIPKVKQVVVYDGKFAIEYLTENRPSLLTTGKVTLRPGETVKEAMTTFAADESFDVVLAIDILHAVHPDERHSVICEWTRLVKPSWRRNRCCVRNRTVICGFPSWSDPRYILSGESSCSEKSSTIRWVWKNRSIRVCRRE